MKTMILFALEKRFLNKTAIILNVAIFMALGIKQIISSFFCIFAPKSNIRNYKKPYDESIPTRSQTIYTV